jgi:uncharacterized membrane protein YgdD (TMEM256/DUF423 family)
MKTQIIWTSLWGALAVGLGAFGAHALKNILSPADLVIWQTGVQYHLVYAAMLLALTLVGILSKPMPKTYWIWAIGSLIFSGTLYILVLSGIRWLGAITPIGGTLMILGWFFFAWEAIKAHSSKN